MRVFHYRHPDDDGDQHHTHQRHVHVGDDHYNDDDPDRFHVNGSGS